MRLLLLGLILAASTASARAETKAETWADTAGSDPQFAASKAICAKAKAVSLPAADRAAPKDCDSDTLLYGIGRPADPAAARACALAELQKGADDPLSGAATLAAIYANGSGVARNYDIAIAYACRLEGAPMEMDGRIKHLARLRSKGPDTAPFDICDDITSGLMEGACAGRAGALADAARTRDIAAVVKKLDGASRAAFAKLEAAEKAFVAAVGDNEVDLSGTARTALVIAAQRSHADAFLATVRAVLAGKPLGDAAAAPVADKALNAAYSKLMALKDVSGLGTVEKSGIKTTQRAWLAYRDAFLAFAKAAAPQVAPAALAATLTQARTEDLTTLLGS